MTDGKVTHYKVFHKEESLYLHPFSRAMIDCTSLMFLLPDLDTLTGLDV